MSTELSITLIVALLAVGALLAIRAGIRSLQSARKVAFFRTRRAHILAGWQWLTLALVLSSFSAASAMFGEPVANRLFPPPTSTPLPSQTPTSTPLPTATSIPSTTNTNTSTMTLTPEGTLTPTPTFTQTASQTPSQTPTRTATLTPSPTHTPTASRTLIPTSTPFPTRTPRPTWTPSPTRTRRPTLTFTVTSTATLTSTASITPSFTLTPTITQTPTQTHTPIPTSTSRPTTTPRPTSTRQPTNTSTFTATITNTPTNTSSPTLTFTPSLTHTISNTPLPTKTVSLTATKTQTPSRTPRPTLLVTSTVTATATPSQTLTQTPSITPTFTDAPTLTLTPIPTSTVRPTNTLTLPATITDTLSQTSTPSLTSTVTFKPSQTRTRTPTPNPGCDRVELIANLTVPDNAVFSPGSSFTKIWRLMNSGTCTWKTTYRVVFVSGNRMGGQNLLPLPEEVAPGETIDLAMNFTAPRMEGSYRGNWQIRNDRGELFGITSTANRPFWVSIAVRAPASTGTRYDFVANACSARWFSGASNLRCPGDENDKNGFILPQNNARLEDGRLDTRRSLLIAPQDTFNGYIRGVYPSYKVQDGDHFQAVISCEYQAESCDVLFRLDYVANGLVRNIWGFEERYDGRTFTVDLDLSTIAGQEVRFVLLILSRGSASGDRALWVEPRIVRSGVVLTTPAP